ncbi:MAG TPA: cohesin domain-containing protein [Thermoanaerobaculia bacterium]|nr:cohesin domain-containing protein [Thermoanaerobaculia bacterium]
MSAIAGAGRGGRLFALALSLSLAACGGGGSGGGGGGGGGGITDPTPGVTFTPSGGGASNSITLVRDAAASSGDTLVLQVQANGVSDLYGVAFDLLFPAQVLAFREARDGSFLLAGGAATSLQVSESSPGNLVVGLTRLGDAGGASGSGMLLDLRFQATASGNGSLSFTRNRAFRPDGTEMSLSWHGGTVTVVR